MVKNIWLVLKSPFFVLAPMEDVTDTVFRRIISTVGRPDLYFSEFTSCEGMLSVGQRHVVHRLKFEKEEKPIVAQIWGIHPNAFFEAAKTIKSLGFDGIDINMGCPVKSVIKQGACSALIKNPDLAKEIISATKQGAGGLPVSVKTRIGFDAIQTNDWVTFLLSQQIDALTLHARTVKELSKVPAHWEEVARAVKIRDTLGVYTKVIGNGDIESYQEGLDRIVQTKCDGVMVGRGILHNPWLFSPEGNKDGISTKMRLDLLEGHIRLFDKVWKSEKKFQVLKKYVKIYISEFEGSSDMRKNLMSQNSASDTLKLITKYRDKFGA